MPDLEILRVPDIEFSAFYFPEIAARLRRHSRTTVPEITNEDNREIFIQLERAFALMGHYNNVLLDTVANDMFLKTARLPESVKLLLALINYRMLSASPAEADLLGTMARTYATTIRLLNNNSKFATRRTPDFPELVFENNNGNIDTTYRTDQLSESYVLEKTKSGTLDSSSLNSDIVTNSTGNTWTTTDINKYIQVSGSVLGNNTEDLRIIELIDESAPGVFDKVRLEGGSFVSETGLTWVLREMSDNLSSDLTAGINATFFAGVPVQNDKFYFGHADIMFDRYDMELASVGVGVVSVIEFYDPSDTTIQPDTVAVDPVGSPGTLQMTVTSLLGTEQAQGAVVRVMHVPSGAETTVNSERAGGLNLINIEGYMGQTTPSSLASDYLVFAEWRPIDSITNTTQSSVNWDQDGYEDYTIPQSRSDNWQKYAFYDKVNSAAREGYVLRYRVVNNVSATGPVPDTLNIIAGTQYALVTTTQGKTVQDDPLGSSNADADQEFVLTRTPYMRNTIRVFVDEGGGDIEWTSVETLLTSYPTDRHFVADVQTDGTCVIIFGDGTNGKIPALGSNNIRAVYRIGGDQDGNIGAGTLTVNRDGVNVFTAVTNPRAGQYWVEADWASQDSLERVKREGPRALRTMSRAVTDNDIEVLAQAFTTSTGVKPVARARSYEEAFGPKTVELSVAGQGGAALTQSQKETLEEFFNGGDTYAGVVVLNHEVTVSNYIPRSIGYTLEVTARSPVTEAVVLQTLSSLVSPTALEEDRVTYVWNFGQEVPNSRVIHEIFAISPGNVDKVVISSPSVDVGLETRELPILDVANTNIVIIEPTV